MADIKSTQNEDVRAKPDDLVELYDRLDQLWIRYLTLLDEYHAAQDSVKRIMSAGFLSIAQANFASPRTRFGRDYYDQRAMATSRVDIKLEENGQVQFGMFSTNDPQVFKAVSLDTGEGIDGLSMERESRSNKTNNDTGLHGKQLPSPSPTPEPEAEVEGTEPPPQEGTCRVDDASGSTNGLKDAHDGSNKNPNYVTDPLRWFGILVPPALRSAQDSFKGLLKDEHGLLKAVNSAKAMRDIEAEIRKIRKTIRKLERGLALEPTATA